MVLSGDAATLFHDRRDAGRRLGRHLEDYCAASPIVFGIPRGGVPVAAEVACELRADLDIIAVRKLGAPFNPEVAIGAVAADGTLYLDRGILHQLEIGPVHLRRLVAVETAEARRQEAVYREGRPAGPVAGRTVFLVDDGLATGATMRVAARCLRRGGPRCLIVAAPVGSRQACRELEADADEVVCLATPADFHAVGHYYARFDQVEDAEVARLLNEYQLVRR